MHAVKEGLRKEKLPQDLILLVEDTGPVSYTHLLNRILELRTTGERFEGRTLPEFRIENEAVFPAQLKVCLLYTSRCV